MAVQLWYLGVSLLLSLQYTDAGGSCQDNIYLEVGKQGLVSCHFENFEIIGWINGDGDVTVTSPFIYLEVPQIYGRGYESGDYDMHPNGSLIINEVKLTNEFNYTVLFVPSGGANEYFKVPVKVYVLPELGYPVVNGRTNQVVVHQNTIGFINCSMTGIRPRAHLEWVFSQDEISLNNSHRVTDNSDGTYNTYLTSSYKVINCPTGRVSLTCRVAGQLADLFPSVTTVYMLLEQRFPVVNGLANQQHVVLDVNREGELTCSMDKVSQDVALELVTIFPDSSDEIVLDNENKITVNGDDTVNITLTSSFRVLSDSTQHLTLQCRVSGQAADKYPKATTVELLVTESFPAVNGLANQQHVVLDVNREGELTCSMDKVSQDVALELVTIFPDSSDEILLENKYHITVNGDDTVNITLISRFRVLSDSTQRFTLQCRVLGQAANKYPEATTMELLVTENQDWEGRIVWPQTYITVLLTILLIEINLFLITSSKLFKDYVRKFYRNCANSRQQDLAEAEHSIRQEEGVPLQPVNNKDNIEARCCQCIPLRETHAKICHLLECHLVPVAAQHPETPGK